MIMIRIIVISIICFLYSSTYAKLIIDITQSQHKKIYIAIIPFKEENDHNIPISYDILNIIITDLNYSGYFNILTDHEIFEHSNGINNKLFKDMNKLKQDWLLTGKINRFQDGTFTVFYRLINIYKNKILFQKYLTANKFELRDIAHNISDDIFKSTIGISGIFSTKLAYVKTNKERSNFMLGYSDIDGAREKIIFNSNENKDVYE